LNFRRRSRCRRPSPGSPASGPTPRQSASTRCRFPAPETPRGRTSLRRSRLDAQSCNRQRGSACGGTASGL
jgi:hypothetical protein